MKPDVKIMIALVAAAVLLLSAQANAIAEVKMAQRYRAEQINPQQVVLAPEQNELASSTARIEGLTFTGQEQLVMQRYPKIASLRWPKFISLRYPQIASLRSPKFMSLRYPKLASLRSPRFISL